MSLIVVKAISVLCASFMFLTATVSEIGQVGGQRNSSILGVGLYMSLDQPFILFRFKQF